MEGQLLRRHPDICRHLFIHGRNFRIMLRHHKGIRAAGLIRHGCFPAPGSRIKWNSVHLIFLLPVISGGRDHCDRVSCRHSPPVGLIQLLTVSGSAPGRQRRHIIIILYVGRRIDLEHRDQEASGWPSRLSRCKMVRGKFHLLHRILCVDHMKRSFLQLLIEVPFLLRPGALSLDQGKPIVLPVPEADMGVVAKPVIVRDPGAADSGHDLSLCIRKQIGQICPGLRSIAEMKARIMGPDERSLPGAAPQARAGDPSLKSGHLHFARGIFSCYAPNGLGSASSNGPHDVGIENICIILEACDPSHIAAALDPGVQAVSSIYRAV